MTPIFLITVSLSCALLQVFGLSQKTGMRVWFSAPMSGTLQITCNSRFGGSGVLLGPPQAYTHTCPHACPPHTNKNEKQIALHLVLRSQFLALHYLHVPWEPPYALLGCLSACLISTHWVPAAASCIFWQLNIFVDMSKCSGGTKRSVTVNHSSYVTSLAL